MQFFKTILFFLSALAFTGCGDSADEKNATSLNAASAKPFSPIEGNWILVSNEVYGREVKASRYPQQLKMFHDGLFSFVMYDSAGNFYYAGAGPYETDGNIYKETFTYSSDTAYINAKDWQRWEMKGDTLIFYGYEKAELANGKDVTEEWGGKGKFIEKRVRATR